MTRADVFTERSGRSRGCGLVEFADPEQVFFSRALLCCDILRSDADELSHCQAKAAMASLNNTELEGRLIFVREDREAREN